MDMCVFIGLIQYLYCKTGNESENVVACVFLQKERDCKVLSGYPKHGSSAEQYIRAHTPIQVSILYIAYF